MVAPSPYISVASAGECGMLLATAYGYESRISDVYNISTITLTLSLRKILARV